MTAARMGAGAVKAVVTPWFPASAKPARKGFYDYKYSQPRDYTFNAQWTGECWLIYDAAEPFANGDTVAMCDGDEWRGLAADPSKAAK